MRRFIPFFVIGFLYMVWLRCTGLGIPCPFRMVTGWKCPGCGISTMILCMTELDFAGAFQANPFLFVTWPLIVGEILFQRCFEKTVKEMQAGTQAKMQEKAEEEMQAINNSLLIAYLIALLIFGIARNLTFTV